tara:strand:- start:426 stop:995 length:570 start_codon:yes stop_codon:yes gene_type:complete
MNQLAQPQELQRVPHAQIKLEEEFYDIPRSVEVVFRAYPELRSGVYPHANRFIPFGIEDRESDRVTDPFDSLMNNLPYLYHHANLASQDVSASWFQNKFSSDRVVHAANQRWPYALGDLTVGFHFLALARGREHIGKGNMPEQYLFEEIHGQIGAGDTFCLEQIDETLRTQKAKDAFIDRVADRTALLL